MTRSGSFPPVTSKSWRPRKEKGKKRKEKRKETRKKKKAKGEKAPVHLTLSRSLAYISLAHLLACLRLSRTLPLFSCSSSLIFPLSLPLLFSPAASACGELFVQPVHPRSLGRILGSVGETLLGFRRIKGYSRGATGAVVARGSSSSTRPANGAVAINAAAPAVGSAPAEVARFHSQPPQQDRKGGKRIVPAARIPDGNASTSRGNAHQSAMDLKTAGKDHNMPYLSTAYSGGSGLQASYPLYPESPSSSLISPASATPRTGLSSPIPEQEVPTAHWKTSRSACDTPYSRASPIPEQEVPTAQWKTSRSACDTPYSRNSPSNIFGLDSAASRNYMLDNNFFRPAASAQFYLDQAQQSFPYNNGGRISVSRDKQDAEEVEAYRASFGFSADEIVTTQAYVEIPDALDEGFSISPFGNNAPATEVDKPLFNVKVTTSPKKSADQLSNDSPHNVVHLDIFKGTKGGDLSEDEGVVKDCHPFRKAMDEISLKPIEVRKKVQPGQSSSSDAEIEYRRARSLREANGVLSWRSTLARQLQ
uniref:Uncharacterized protein n=1 Tax=Oryza nivara TaxID=4536 RepID=A0A0E0GKQ9_ORYNI